MPPEVIENEAPDVVADEPVVEASAPDPVVEEPAPVDEAPKTALEAAVAASNRLREKSEAEVVAAEPKKPDAEAEAEPAVDDDLTGRVANAEWDAMNQRQRARVTQYRTRLAQLNDQVKADQPRAQAYAQLEEYIQASRISQEDFVEALELARLVKADPAKAYERMQPLIQQLQGHVGERLPDDLSKAVEEGSMAEEHAKQLARERAERARLSGELSTRDREAAEARQQQSVKATQEKVYTALNDLEAVWKTTDPDYTRKNAWVWERMQAIITAEGQALTDTYMVDVAKRAKQEIDERVKSFLPKARQTRPAPDASGAPASTAAAPKSSLEAANLALAQMRARG